MKLIPAASVFYIENFVEPEQYRIVLPGKNSYWMKNIFVYVNKSLLTEEIEESVFIPLRIRAVNFIDKHKLKFFYSHNHIVHTEDLDKKQYVTTNGTYDRKKIDELEPIIKDHLSEIINEYFNKKGI